MSVLPWMHQSWTNLCRGVHDANCTVNPGFILFKNLSSRLLNPSSCTPHKNISMLILWRAVSNKSIYGKRWTESVIILVWFWTWTESSVCLWTCGWIWPEYVTIMRHQCTHTYLSAAFLPSESAEEKQNVSDLFILFPVLICSIYSFKTQKNNRLTLDHEMIMWQQRSWPKSPDVVFCISKMRMKSNQGSQPPSNFWGPS